MILTVVTERQSIVTKPLPEQEHSVDTLPNRWAIHRALIEAPKLNRIEGGALMVMGATLDNLYPADSFNN